MLSEVAKRLITRSPKESQSSGADAKWVSINSRFGLKYFPSKDIRDNTYFIQSLAYKLGIAPALGKKFEIEIDGWTYYGYVCERIVETFRDFRLARIAAGIPNDGVTDRGEDVISEYCQLLKDEYNITLVDMHHNNYGFMPNGDIAIIDFSSAYIKYNANGDEIASYDNKNMEEMLASHGIVYT